MLSQQLNLALSLSDEALFDNFLTAPGSVRLQVVDLLRAVVNPVGRANIFLWGAAGSGLTHLLQAACHEASRRGQRMQYLPLSELTAYPAEDVLQGLEFSDLVCLDKLEAIVGIPQWEEALFHLFNALQASGGQLLITADASPRTLGLTLADLESRLMASTIFYLPTYSDEDKVAVVRFRAAGLGLHLSDEALFFLMNRAPRSLSTLIEYLHQLDRYALQYQSKVTIPLMKKVFGW